MPISQTANAFIADQSYLAIKQTAALRALTALSAMLDATDDDSWVDIGAVTVGFDPGQPPQPQTVDEYVSNSAVPITLVPKAEPTRTMSMTILDSDDSVEDHGTTNNISVTTILREAAENRVEVPLRFAPKGNSTGNRIHDYGSAKPLSVSEPAHSSTATEGARVTIQWQNSGNPTRSTVA